MRHWLTKIAFISPGGSAVESLPAEGFHEYSKTEWMSWYSAMSEAAGVVSGLANKEPRARSSSCSRSSSAPRGSSLCVSGQSPAQGLPAQGGELIQFQPPLWTQVARLVLHLFPQLRWDLVTTNIALFLVEAPPPLCNRMGVEWRKPMADYHC